MREDQRSNWSAAEGRRSIGNLVIFALILGATQVAMWKLASTITLMRLTPHENARLANLGELPQYRDATAALKPDSNRVVFLGNSITYGRDIANSSLNSGYVNRGINGQTSADMLVRFREEVIDLQPKAVVILAGVNDFGEHESGGDDNDERKLAHLKANDETMAEFAELHRIRPVFIWLLPLHAYTPPARISYSLVSPAMMIAANQWLRGYCKEHHYQFIDAYSAVIDEHRMLRIDLSQVGLHPNSAGYRIMTGLFSNAYHDEWRLPEGQPGAGKSLSTDCGLHRLTI